MNDQQTVDSNVEAEAMKVRDMFSAAANAIVKASELAREVAAMRSEMDRQKHDSDAAIAGLRLELDSLKGHNTWLEGELNQTREKLDATTRERDEAQKSYEQESNLHQSTIQQHNTVIDKLNQVSADHEAMIGKHSEVLRELNRVRQELEIANSKIVEVRRRTRELEGVVADRCDSIFHVLGAEEPEPQAQGYSEGDNQPLAAASSW